MRKTVGKTMSVSLLWIPGLCPLLANLNSVHPVPSSSQTCLPFSTPFPVLLVGRGRKRYLNGVCRLVLKGKCTRLYTRCEKWFYYIVQYKQHRIFLFVLKVLPFIIFLMAMDWTTRFLEKYSYLVLLNITLTYFLKIVLLKVILHTIKLVSSTNSVIFCKSAGMQPLLQPNFRVFL